MDASGTAYELAMEVSTALAALPEFSRQRCDDIGAACWKLNPKTGKRGSAPHVEAALVEVRRLGEEAARDEAGAEAIVEVLPKR
jgi:hypothetical protein